MAAMGLPGSFFSGAVEREEREQQREAEAEAHELRVQKAWEQYSPYARQPPQFRPPY